MILFVAGCFVGAVAVIALGVWLRRHQADAWQREAWDLYEQAWNNGLVG